MSDWFSKLKNAKKTCITQDNLRKVHYELPDGKEMVEEYNMTTNVLSRRAWRLKSRVGEDKWDIEIGDPEPSCLNTEDMMIKESAAQPFVSRRITKNSLEWRIRNLPYPVETYSVTVDQNKKCLTVRTTNKKYFKELSVPDLERANLSMDQNNLEFTHKYNTLIITYKKPQQLIELENALFEEVRQLKTKNANDMDCKPS